MGNKVEMLVNNVKLGKELNQKTSETVEALSLVNPASEAFQKAAKDVSFLFGKREDTDTLTIKVSKTADYEKDGIKTVKVTVKTLRNLADIALKDAPIIDYAQSRGGNPNATDKGEIMEL